MFGILRIFIALAILLQLPATLTGAYWAFLPDQSKCRIDCLNGGVCSFLRDQPEVHKCICLIGIWEGERCEQKVESQSNEQLGGAMSTTLPTSLGKAGRTLLKGEEDEEQQHEEDGDWPAKEDNSYAEEDEEHEIEEKAKVDERKEKREGHKQHRMMTMTEETEEEEEEAEEEKEAEEMSRKEPEAEEIGRKLAETDAAITTTESTTALQKGGSSAPNRPYAETNTMAFEEVVESRARRPPPMPTTRAEEVYEEESMRKSSGGGKMKKRKRPKMDAEGGSGSWMLAKRGERRWRSASTSVTSNAWLLIGVTLITTMMALRSLRMQMEHPII